MDNPNSYLGPPFPGLVEQLHEVDAAIGRTECPGVQFQAGILDGSVYLYAMAFPLSGKPEAVGFRGRYHFVRRGGMPISMVLFAAAKDAWEDMTKAHFRHGGHWPHARLG